MSKGFLVCFPGIVDIEGQMQQRTVSNILFTLRFFSLSRNHCFIVKKFNAGSLIR
ncbi:hypothetical protein D3C78_1972410 [compost metagenome]